MYSILNKTNSGISIGNIHIRSNDSVILSDDDFNSLDQTALSNALTGLNIEVANLNPPAVVIPPPEVTLNLVQTILGSITGFLYSAKDAVLRTFNDKVQDNNPTVKDFYQKADGNDYGPALTRALATGLPVYWPAGNYTVANPVNMVNYMSVTGAARCRSGGGKGATYISAPNGLFVNTTGKRASILVENLHVVGNDTGCAIQGPFGGDIIGNKFEHYSDLIQNPSSYLSRYSNNSFRSANNALNLADCNGTIVQENHFEASVRTAINNQDITPLSGTNNGAPLIIRGNNINISLTNFQNQSCMKVRGMIIGYGNYFEDFSASPSGAVMVDVIVNRWDKMSFVWFGNQMNGQGKALYGLRFNGTATYANSAAGAVYGNRIAGFTGSAINFGSFNNVSDLRIMDNNYGNSDTAITGGPLIAYKPVVSTKFSSVVDVSSTTPVDLPIGQTVVLDNSASVSGNTVKIQKGGLYRITAMVDFSATTELSLWDSSTKLESSHNGTILTLLNLTAGHTLKFKAGSGKTATSGTFALEHIGDGNA